MSDLLKPRYKVIADYPGSSYKIGEILVYSGQPMPIRTLEAFPHLFKRMYWWEDRKPEEMPEYLKSTISPYAIVKPSTYRVDHGCFIIDGLDFPESLSLYEPATEAEYLNQNK